MTDAILARVGLESLTTFGLPAIDLVHLAADLGCGFVATGLTPFTINPENYPPSTLRDAATRQEMKRVMADRSVALGLGQGFAIFPERDVRDLIGDLEMMCELGVTRIGGVSLDTDLARTEEQLGALAEMAGAMDVEIMLEFVPTRAIPDLPAAMAVIRRQGCDNIRLMVDCMHLIRSGGSAADVAALDPAVIGYVQICDAPLVPTNPDYLDEAVTERGVPGKGELPLADILAALPDDVPIGIEIPMLARALAGDGPKLRARDCVNATRHLLAAR